MLCEGTTFHLDGFSAKSHIPHVYQAAQSCFSLSGVPVMQRFFSYFRTHDATVLVVIFLLSATSARLPDVFESSYPYPSALYSIFTTVAQSLAPLFAILLAAGLYLRSKDGERDLSDLVKSSAIACCVIMLSLALMPFAEMLFAAGNIRQGVATALLLLSFWSLGRGAASMFALLVPEKNPDDPVADEH